MIWPEIERGPQSVRGRRLAARATAWPGSIKLTGPVPSTWKTQRLLYQHQLVSVVARFGQSDKGKIKVTFTIEQVMKTQTGSKGIAVLFL
jgi:hypothetical protein